ncbi:DUF1731 domain-containing protein, partial [Enterobacter intestinihominis]
ALHRPAILRVPATAIRLLMGESSVLVLGGARALPKILVSAGFSLRLSLIKKSEPTRRQGPTRFASLV